MAKPPKPVRAGEVRAKVRSDRGCIDGRWYWVAEAYDGRRDVTVATRRATRAEALTWIVDVAAGHEVTQRRASGEVLTVRDLLAAYLGDVESRADIVPATKRVITRHAYAFTGYPRAALERARPKPKSPHGTIGEVLLEHVGRAGLERHRNLRLSAGIAPRTVQEELRVLGTAWRWARDVGHASCAPPEPPSMPERPVRNRRTPTAQDVAAVLPHLVRPWQRAVLRVLWATGCRIGEVSTLTVADVMLADLLLVVDGKTGRREVPIGRDVAALLRPLVAGREASERVWPVMPATVEHGMLDALREACSAAGVPVFTPHGIRRSVVDRLARARVDVATASSITGHSVKVMLDYYRTVTEEDRRDAVRRARLSSLPGDVVVLDAVEGQDTAAGHPRGKRGRA